jgi:hypothetical protein
LKRPLNEPSGVLSKDSPARKSSSRTGRSFVIQEPAVENLARLAKPPLAGQDHLAGLANYPLQKNVAKHVVPQLILPRREQARVPAGKVNRGHQRKVPASKPMMRFAREFQWQAQPEPAIQPQST